MFCEKCGNELPDGVRYCNKCGTRVTPTQPDTGQKSGGQKKEKPKKGGGVPIVVWVLLAVGIGAAGAAFGKHMILDRGGSQEDKGTAVVYETKKSEPETSGSGKTGGSTAVSGKSDGSGAIGEKADSQAGQPGVSSADESAALPSADGSKETEGREAEREPETTDISAARETPAKEVSLVSEMAAGTGPQAGTDSQYVLPGSDSRYIDVRELENLTAEQCRLARNEIYARHGRRFNDEELQAYFDSRDWYTGTMPPENFREELLNEYELYNRDLIVKYEKEHGYQ